MNANDFEQRYNVLSLGALEIIEVTLIILYRIQSIVTVNRLCSSMDVDGKIGAPGSSSSTSDDLFVPIGLLINHANAFVKSLLK